MANLTTSEKPQLFKHASGQWAKKIKGKLIYFGTDQAAALQRYADYLARLDSGLPVVRVRRRRQSKARPSADFPLFRHATGQWAKKIKGKLIDFGTDADAALNKYLDEKDDRQAGRTPPGRTGDKTIADVCNAFLTSKKLLLESGELAPITWRNYYDVCERMVAFFGKSRPVLDLNPDDFEKLRSKFSTTRGPAALASSIQKVRTVFKYAYDAELIERPVRFGPSFRKPSKKAIRKAKQASGPRMMEAEELRTIIATARQPIKAMVLLGINCAFGQTDVASLPISAIDFKKGWVDFPRPKTAIARRCRLWPETVQAVRDVIDNHRPDPKDLAADGQLVFITKYGMRWVRVRSREKGGCVPVDSINLEFNKLLNSLKLKRTGGFYNLRHVFRTVAGACKDERAIDGIMGHVREDMGSDYTERIDDDRLQAVVDVVHAWLWKTKPVDASTEADPTILQFKATAG